MEIWEDRGRDRHILEEEREIDIYKRKEERGSHKKINSGIQRE